MKIINQWNPIGWVVIAVTLCLMFAGLALQDNGRAALQGAKGSTEPSARGIRFAGGFQIETLASGLDTPWDLSWGPDARIWVTERTGAISRINPVNGQVTRAGGIHTIAVSESGLMGLAFHPDFASQPYVYVVHSYGSKGSIKIDLYVCDSMAFFLVNRKSCWTISPARPITMEPG